MCVSLCLYVCIYTRCMPGSYEGQKKVLNPLEMELPMVVIHHFSTEHWTGLSRLQPREHWLLFLVVSLAFNEWTISLAVEFWFLKVDISS